MKNHFENKLYASIDLDGWQSWFPRDIQKPLFESYFDEGIRYLKIASDGRRHSYGKWYCIVGGLTGGETYRFYVEYLAEGIVCTSTSISVILTWQGENGQDITRDYVDEVYNAGDGWVGLERTVDTPAEARILKIELVLKWPGEGSVIWRAPCLTKVEAIRPRKVRLATTYIHPYIQSHRSYETNMKRISEALEQAGSVKPDVICLSETINDRGLDIPLVCKCETLSGPFVSLMAEKARHYNCYMVFSFHEIKDGHFYNTAVLLDRKGEIAGTYHKTHLAMCEGEEGIIPGEDYPVFTTDFGKIGMLICWDHYFPEPARILRLKGAEILFIMTAGDIPVQTIARAIDNGLYVVVAGASAVKPGSLHPSRIINPMGEVIGQVEDRDIGVCIREIDLNKRFYSYWLSVGPAFGEARSIYAMERRPETYKLLTEGYILRK
jgi:predicted amidohydrolase